jgi:hypothetical protein
MITRDIVWEQSWIGKGEGLLSLRCVAQGAHMHYQIIQPEAGIEGEAQLLREYSSLNEARRWLVQHGYIADMDEDSQGKPIDRRMTPQHRKRISYERDTRQISTGKGASRRVKQFFPKFRRRQVRRRMKALLRHEIRCLHREIRDQDFRSIKAGDVPEYGKSLPLKKALDEKERRRQEGEKTTHIAAPDQKPAQIQSTQRGTKSTEGHLPIWLRRRDI